MTNALFSVAVFASDADARARLVRAVGDDAAARIVEVDDLDALVTIAAATLPEVVVADASLVESEPDVVDALRRAAPGVGVVVLTCDALLDDAMRVLQARVDEFFPTAIDDERLRSAVRALADAAMRRRGGDGGMATTLDAAALE